MLAAPAEPGPAAFLYQNHQAAPVIKTPARTILEIVFLWIWLTVHETVKGKSHSPLDYQKEITQS